MANYCASGSKIVVRVVNIALVWRWVVLADNNFLKTKNYKGCLTESTSVRSTENSPYGVRFGTPYSVPIRTENFYFCVEQKAE